MTNSELTQAALEQWAMPNAQAQATQLGAEVWASASAGTRLALLTQIALEEWASAAPPPPLLGTLATTEGIDAAAFAGTAAWPSISGTLGAIEAPDLAAFTGSPGLLPTVTIKLGMQILVNRQSTLGYWVPAIVTGIALDQVPIVFGCWSQGPPLGTSGQMGIMLNIADHGTTWVNAGGAP